jgi:hypothetical protein
MIVPSVPWRMADPDDMLYYVNCFAYQHAPCVNCPQASRRIEIYAPHPNDAV